jgi:predicted MFS family arabinose efflux permease
LKQAQLSKARSKKREKTNSRARNAAIGAIVLNTFSMGGYSTLSLYLVPLSKLLNVSVGQLVLLFTVAGITSFLTALRFGSLLKRFKP